MMVCQCEGARKCDPCAERDLEALRLKVMDDADYRRDEALRCDAALVDALRNPRPEARESQAGFHRAKGKPASRVEAVTEGQIKAISDRVRAYREKDAPTGWCCPSCGPLTPHEMPLVGEDDAWHCPRVECDAVVSRQ
jgi:hypothetical protein